MRHAPWILGILALSILFLPAGLSSERIRLLALSKNTRFPSLKNSYQGDPAIDFHIVLSRHGRMSDDELRKLIRLYFPRTYEDFRSYDVLVLACPTYNLFSAKQDRWIHNSIAEGAGGLNDGSVYSQHLQVASAWASGMAWQAFPNDAPTVTAEYGGWAERYYSIDIVEDARWPIISMFIPYGVEGGPHAGFRLVIPRKGSEVLAFAVGAYPSPEPYLVCWEYEEGRAMTTGGLFPGAWFHEPNNKYAAEIKMNIVFWLAGTPLIDDIEVYHRMRSSLTEFNRRIGNLISLRDFISKFGANTVAIDREIRALRETYAEASDHYLDHNFVKSEEVINSGLDAFPQAEEVAREEKRKALLWVYIIEWLVTSSALFISGFAVWTLMVRRSMYRAVKTTRLKEE